MSAPVDIAVIIITFNEALHIERVLDNVRTFASEIVVVDSFSTDGTPAVAEAMGAQVVQRKFVSHAQQFQWALDNIPLRSTWIMRMDADEIIEPALVEELRTTLPKISPAVVGVNLKRKHIFMGRFIRHGGRYPLVMLRIWRRGHGRVEQRWMDEHVVVDGGTTTTFSNPFADHNLQDLSAFTAKHNGYATREAVDVLIRKYADGKPSEELSVKSSSLQAASKRLIKQRLYNVLPMWAGPLGYFVYRYFFRLGFLDGREGLIYHFLQGYWYRFLVAAKVFEYDRAIASLATRKERLERLEALTGLPLQNR